LFLPRVSAENLKQLSASRFRTIYYQKIYTDCKEPLLRFKGKGSPILETSAGFCGLSRSSVVSSQVTEAINPAVGCRYFPSGPRTASPPFDRCQVIFVRPAVTSPAAEHHRPLAGTKLYCLVTEAHVC